MQECRSHRWGSTVSAVKFAQSVERVGVQAGVQAGARQRASAWMGACSLTSGREKYRNSSLCWWNMRCTSWIAFGSSRLNWAWDEPCVGGVDHGRTRLEYGKDQWPCRWHRLEARTQATSGYNNVCKAPHRVPNPAVNPAHRHRLSRHRHQSCGGEVATRPWHIPRYPEAGYTAPLGEETSSPGWGLKTGRLSADVAAG